MGVAMPLIQKYKKPSPHDGYLLMFVFTLFILLAIILFLRREEAYNDVSRDYRMAEIKYETELRQSLIRQALESTFQRITFEDIKSMKHTRDTNLISFDDTIYVKLGSGEEIIIGYFDDEGQFQSSLEPIPNPRRR